VFVFEEKTASIPLGHPGGENLWAAAFRLIVEEKTWDFLLLSVQFYEQCVAFFALLLHNIVDIKYNSDSLVSLNA
jgi:hypothetical protein